MSKYLRAQFTQQLTREGWVPLSTPDTPRQGYAGEADMTSEFSQATRKHAEYHDHTWFNPNKWGTGVKPRRRIPQNNVLLSDFLADEKED